MKLRKIENSSIFMNMKISFEWFYLTQKCFYEGAFPNSVFSYNSYSISFCQINAPYIEKGILPSNEYIFSFDESFRSVFVV